MPEGDPWLNALLCTPPMICGVQLLPLSLFHERLLLALGNPYAFAGQAAKPEDLLHALQVCSRTWEENREWVRTQSHALLGDRSAIKSVLGKEANKTKWEKAWTSGRLDFSTADASFREYLDAYRYAAKRTALVPKEGETVRELACPEDWLIVGVLMEHRGYTESQAWNCPVNVARCHFDCFSEYDKGDTSIVSEFQAWCDDRMLEAAAIGKAGDMATCTRMEDEVIAIKRERAARRAAG